MRRITAILAVVTLWLAISPSTVREAEASGRRVAAAPAAPARQVSDQPNIVLILTDDQTIGELEHMPIVDSELIGKGVTFSNAFVSNSLCCPSRASILTGKYSHGTDVYRNQPPHGGFATFTGEDSSTVATWLHDGPSRYYTGLVGKYLNGYDSTYIPPGWDSWAAEIIGDSPMGGFYDYNMSLNGVLKYYGSSEADYSTDVLAGYAESFIENAPAGQPLFLYFAPHAPHAPATPPVRYEDSLNGIGKYRPPNFNEADMSDKPPWARSLPLLTAHQIRQVDHFRKDQFRSLLAVDDAVGGILDALGPQRLADTLLVFASDNGLELGSHRWVPKAVPWEEAIRVPMIIRYDPLTHGSARIDDHLVLNLDLASTFAAAGGVDAPGAEGASLLPLLSGQTPDWRDDFLLEHLPGGEGDPGSVPTYCGVRTTRYVYVEYERMVDGAIQIEEELYDIVGDPNEMNNLANQSTDTAIKDQLHQRMVQLCSPPPPGFEP